MNFDLQIVAQAQAFVNACRKGWTGHVPAMPFRLWQQFMTAVNHEMGVL